MYVVYLYGQHVWNNYSIQCVIESLDDLVKVREAIKERCEIEFSERPYRDFIGHKKYTNITDERDVNLIVERTELIK